MKSSSEEFDDWVTGWSSPAPSTYQNSETLAFQRWFKFKEAFSPSLVKSVIESLPTPPSSILDCFGGSGTSGVVAQMLGVQSTLIEVNPFLADLIESKLTHYGNFDVSSAATNLIADAQTINVSIDALRENLPPTFIEPGKSDRWLYSSEVAITIEQIRLAIEKISSKEEKLFFKIALGSILIELSNVKIDGKARRYKKNWQSKIIDAIGVKASFVRTVSAMAEDIARFPMPEIPNFQILRGDCREVLNRIPEKSIDLAIFSPPYPNTFDYTDIYNVELWILQYLKSSKDNKSLRLETMRSHVQVAWAKPIHSILSKTLNDTLHELNAQKDSLWNINIPEMVMAYFIDLERIIEQLIKALKPNGRIAIVIGNSSYAGITVDCSKILTEIAMQQGLRILKCESVRVMRSSAQQSTKTASLNEWLLVLG